MELINSIIVSAAKRANWTSNVLSRGKILAQYLGNSEDPLTMRDILQHIILDSGSPEEAPFFSTRWTKKSSFERESKWIINGFFYPPPILNIIHTKLLISHQKASPKVINNKVNGTNFLRWNGIGLQNLKTPRIKNSSSIAATTIKIIKRVGDLSGLNARKCSW